MRKVLRRVEADKVRSLLKTIVHRRKFLETQAAARREAAGAPAIMVEGTEGLHIDISKSTPPGSLSNSPSSPTFGTRANLPQAGSDDPRFSLGSGAVYQRQSTSAEVYFSPSLLRQDPSLTLHLLSPSRIGRNLISRRRPGGGLEAFLVSFMDFVFTMDFGHSNLVSLEGLFLFPFRALAMQASAIRRRNGRSARALNLVAVWPPSNLDGDSISAGQPLSSISIQGQPSPNLRVVPGSHRSPSPLVRPPPRAQPSPFHSPAARSNRGATRGDRNTTG